MTISDETLAVYDSLCAVLNGLVLGMIFLLFGKKEIVSCFRLQSTAFSCNSAYVTQLLQQMY